MAYRHEGISGQSKYIRYSKLPYNNLCVGIQCDIRWQKGDHKHIEITLCDKCIKKYKEGEKKTKRQRLEAECNEVMDIVYKRIVN